jgi:hypothetical protein
VALTGICARPNNCGAASSANQIDRSRRVYWQTHETNRTAQQLYNKVAEHSGFVVYRKLF